MKVNYPGKPRGSGRNRTNNRIPEKGEVWWVENLRFEGGSGSKDRPVVVLSCDGTDARCLRCTTQNTGARRLYKLLDPEAAGMDREPFVELTAITLPAARLSRRMGALCEDDWLSIMDALFRSGPRPLFLTLLPSSYFL